MKFIFLASKELSWLWNLGFHFPKSDYHQWLKYMYFQFGKSRHIEEFNMLVLLSNSLLLKEEIVQRSGFTRWSPIVAAATFFPNFWKILDPHFDFIFPGFILFPELCFFPLLQIWIFLSLNWGQLFPLFRKLDDLNFPLSSQSFWLWSLFIF